MAHHEPVDRRVVEQRRAAAGSGAAAGRASARAADRGRGLYSRTAADGVSHSRATFTTSPVRGAWTMTPPPR